MIKRFPARRAGLCTAMLMALAVVSPAWAVQPEVLTQVPADAYGVVVVNSARTLSNKVSNAAARMQAGIPADLISLATHSMGIDEGFDANSSLALVFLKPAADKEGPNYFTGMPPAVLLLPTTNSKAMLDNYKPTDPDKDGISTVTLPQNPEEKGYVAVIEKKWIAFAQKREDLVTYMGRGDSFAKAATPETLKVFDANDLVIWGNVERLGQGMDKFLDDRHTEAGGMLDLQSVNGKGDATAGAMQKIAMDMGFKFVKELFADSKANMITVRLTDSGATLGMVGDFKADSPIAKFIASQANRGPVTLKGLPDGNFLMAGTMHWNSASISDLIVKIGDQILGDPVIAKSEKMADMRKAFDTAKQIASITQGTNMMLREPVPGSKDGFITGAGLMETSDPKRLMDLQIENAKSAFAQSGMGQGMKMDVNVTPNAETVKDVALTLMTMKVSVEENATLPPESRMAMDMVKRMYGENGLTVHMGVVGKRLLIVYGSDRGLIESAVAAAQSDSDALSSNPTIVAVKDDVVANPVAIFYMPIARWMTVGQSLMAPGAAAAAPAGNGASAPPVVISVGVTGRMLTGEVHVPIASIVSIQEAYMQLQKAMSGGDGAPPNAP